MSVANSDLVLCGCANHAEDDSSAQGGAIAKGKLLFFSNADIAATDEIEVVASAVITATITVTGKTAAGAALAETLTFTAEAGPKTTTGQFERVTKVVVASGSIPADVTVTVRRETGDVEILKLYGSSVSPTGTAVTEVRKLFLGASIPVTGTNTYYEKAYLLNAHATDALSNPVVSEYADPSGLLSFAIESTAGGTESVANRLTAPTGGGIGSFDSTAKTFAPATLAAGAGVPVWFKLAVPSTETPQKTSVTTKLAGTSP